MALRDYVICGECETKIIYDGYDNGRDRLEEVWGDPNADVWTVHLLCPDCIKKLQADLATAQARVAELTDELQMECEARQRVRALLRDCLPELDGEGVTIHRVWAALAEGNP